jgi:YHS domain-containing protein
VKRLLVAMVIFTVVIYLLRRLAGTAGSSARKPRRRRDRPSGATTMVRDRVCNTFLPRDRALQITRAGEIHYFCSDTCRDRFTATLSDGGARRVS